MSMKTWISILATIMMFTSCNGRGASTLNGEAESAERHVRPATQANRFYTGDARELSEEVDSLLARHSGETVYNNVAALIVPHAGYYFSGNVAAAAYMSIPAGKAYKRIFLLGPSHHELFDGASVNTEFDYYSTPLGNVKVDVEAAQKLIEAESPRVGEQSSGISVFSYRPKAHDREHCLEVQLPFLQRRFKEVPPIVPIIISTNDYRKLKRIAEALKPYLTEENLFVVSSDFSHYPTYEDACKVDARTGKAVESGDVAEFIRVLEENASSHVPNLATSACGELAIATLMLIMQDGGYEVRHLLYQNSGDIERSAEERLQGKSHAHDRVVGYHAFAIIRKSLPQSSSKERGDFSLSDEEKRMLKEIALTSIKDSFDGKPIAKANSSFFTLHSSLKRKCGAFVSLHKQGRLRGCIGHFGEDVPLHEIVAKMARAAAFEDHQDIDRTEHDHLSVNIGIEGIIVNNQYQLPAIAGFVAEYDPVFSVKCSCKASVLF